MTLIVKNGSFRTILNKVQSLSKGLKIPMNETPYPSIPDRTKPLFAPRNIYMRDLGILERDSSPILCLASSVVVLEINSQLGVLQKFKARPP